MRNANKSPKIPYFAMARGVDPDPESPLVLPIGIGPITIPSFSEIG